MISLLLQRKNLFLGILVFSNLLAAAAFILLWYTIDSERTSAAFLEQSIEQKLLRERSGNASERLLLDVAGQQSELEKLILPSDGAVQFIEMIESLAREAGLSLEVQSVSVEPLEGGEEGGLEALKLGARTTGPWNSATRFISLLETVPLSLSVKDLNLNKIEEGGQWNLQFTVTALQSRR